MLLPVWTLLAGFLAWLVAALFDYLPRFIELGKRETLEEEAAKKDPTAYGAQWGDPKLKAAASLNDPTFWTSLRLTSSPTLMTTVVTSAVAFFASPHKGDASLPIIVWVVVLVGAFVLAGLGITDGPKAPRVTRWRVVISSWIVVGIAFGWIAKSTTSPAPESPSCPPCASASPSGSATLR